jgi:Cys-tRNA synthase (O-phospho-L-seryl-tRNA:Cys-tRNA synthase)
MKKLPDTKTKKAVARAGAQEVQSDVKLALQNWIKEGVVEEQLKQIIQDPDTKQSDRIKAIDILTKLAGFENEVVKVSATDSKGDDIPLYRTEFEELKALWVTEIKKGITKTLKDNVIYLDKATDEDIIEIIEEANS